jgi:MFS family permease
LTSAGPKRDHLARVTALGIATPAQRQIWRTYLALNVLFALANGMYASYAFLYLKRRLLAVGGIENSLLDSLLLVLVISMSFEFFLDPYAGDLADARGRRRIVILAFAGQALAFLAYWSASASPTHSFGPRAQSHLVTTLGIVGELAFAAAAALFNGSLDAWFVDELRLAGWPPGESLQPFFSTQRKYFGGSMLIGGMASLGLASSASVSGDLDSMLSRTAAPWALAAAIAVIACILCRWRLAESFRPLQTATPTVQRLRGRLKRTIGSRSLRAALIASSVLYTGWICFLYLAPVLLTEPSLMTESGPFEQLLRNYYWFYLAVGACRLVGPAISNRFRLGGSAALQFRRWGLVNGSACALAGGLLLLRAPVFGLPSTVRVVLVPVAIASFLIAKLAEEAFKPVRTTYLNDLLPDGEDRAFVLSMTTPLGALVILLGAAVLAASGHGWKTLQSISFALPVLFVFIGLLGMLSIMLLLRDRYSAPRDVLPTKLTLPEN